MTRSVRPLMIGLLSALALLVLAGPGQAQYRGWRARAVRRSAFPPNRMPGWDWWRTYPWSPYNYGRNPYNPIVYPQPTATGEIPIPEPPPKPQRRPRAPRKTASGDGAPKKRTSRPRKKQPA